VFAVRRVKTSIYIDKELWDKLKEYAKRKGVGVSRLLEEAIRDEIVEEELINTLLDIAGKDNYELDFKPVKTKSGLVSDLVREMRSEMENGISRQ
jgi:hypothetical protein